MKKNKRKNILIIVAIFLSIILMFVFMYNPAYVRGTLTETAFESKYMDLRFTLPGGYFMATENELREMHAETNSLAIGNTLDNYAALATVYEMMAISASGNLTVTVMAEKLDYSKKNAKQYFEILEKQLAKIYGADYVFSDAIQIDFAGKSYHKVSAKGEMREMIITQDFIFRKHYDRMIGLVLTYTDDMASEVPGLLQAFSAY